MGRPKRELSEGEAEIKRRVLSDMNGEDLLTVVNQDKKFEYYFAAKDPGHPQSADRLKRVGYEVVDKNNNSGEEAPMGVVPTTENGPIQLADNILMRIPKDWYEMRREAELDEMDRRSSQPQHQFEESMRNAEAEGARRKTFVFNGSGAGRR